MRLYETKIGNLRVISEHLHEVLGELELLLKETEHEITVKAVEMEKKEYDKMEEFKGW